KFLSSDTGVVTCPPGFKVTSGGFSPIKQFASFPSSDSSWTCRGANTNCHALCVKFPASLANQLDIQYLAEPMSSTQATVTCPDGYTAVGAGIEGAAGNFEFAHPNTVQPSLVNCVERNMSSPICHAVCMKNGLDFNLSTTFAQNQFGGGYMNAGCA